MRLALPLAAVLTLAACGSSQAPVTGATTSREAQVSHALSGVTGADARVADDLDRSVILRGVNLNSLGEYYQEFPDLPATLALSEDDFAGMAAMGFNVVRLIVTWSRIEPQRGVIDTAYFERIAQALEWARAHDIYVLLDMHQDAWSPYVGTPDGVSCPPPLQAVVGWDGAPAWATALTGTVATCALPLGREFSVAVQTSFEQFYLDLGGVQGELINSWAALAGRFAADPVVAGYDLLNEPNPGLTAGVDDYLLLGQFYSRALNAIRAAESAAPGGFAHAGFFEPSVITGPLALPGPVPLGFTSDTNLVYAPHLYNESINPLPLPGAQTMEQGFANAATAASNYGTTFFSGEWGWFGDSESDAVQIRRYAALEDQYRVGGTWWQWKQACGDPHAVGTRGHRPPCADTGSPYSDGIVVRARSNTMILDRAYPRAAPGLLDSIEADVDSGGLNISGRARRGGTSADLWLPARCASPVVTGENIAAATRRRVTGGWRIAVPVPAVGAYRVNVSCG